MPNRVIRNWTASESVDRLTQGAEIFFTRLIMCADDYGNYVGNLKLIKAALFPLKDYKIPQIESWLDECIYVNLVAKYTIEDKEYIHIHNFDQNLRRMKNTYPPPNVGDLRTSDGQVTDKRGKTPPETKQKRNESETESEGATAEVVVWPTFDDFWNAYGKKIDRPKCEKKWKKLEQGAREEIMIHVDEYVKSTPDIQFRKHPATYLNNESWKNEIITHNGKRNSNYTGQGVSEYFDHKYGQGSQGTPES